MIFNFIMLSAKYHIVRCKYTKVNPEIELFINYLKKDERVERFIAQNKDKLTIHNTKWNNILN